MDKRQYSWVKIVFFIGLIAAIFGITFFSYLEVLNNEFQRIDTKIFVVDNPHIRSLSAANLSWMLTEIKLDHWHPLTWFSYALDYVLYGGLDPRGFHLTSLVLHGFNAVWLFVFVVVLLTIIRTDSGSSPSAPSLLTLWRCDNQVLMAAAIAGSLFGVHAQHVESVAWVAERKDVLSQFFILPTLVVYLYYGIHAAAGKRRLSLYLLTLVGFCLATASKVIMITIPAVLLLLDIYPLRRLQWHVNNLYEIVLIEKLPFLVLAITAAILTILGVSHSMVALSELGILHRILNSFNNIIFYMSKTVLPTGFSFYYPFPAYESVWDYIRIGTSISAFFLITFLTIDQWKRGRIYWLIGWLYYLFTLTPVVGIFQSGAQAAAVRYTYLTSLPIFIIAGAGLSNLFYSRRKLVQIGSVFIFAAIIWALVSQTRQQTLYWRDSLTLWTHAALYSPNQPIAHFNLGIDYLHNKRYKRALSAFSRAKNLGFGGDAYYGMGLAYTQLGKFDQAMDHYQYVIANGLDVIDGRDNVYAAMALVRYQQKRYAEAATLIAKAAEINPDNRLARKLRGQLANRVGQ